MGILSDLFGEPNEGAHVYRVGPGDGFAIVDIALTLLAAYALARWRVWAFGTTLVGLLLLAVATHYLFDVRTKLNRVLFYGETMHGWKDYVVD